MDLAANDDGPQDPIFFLSYAHNSNPQFVENFFTLLCGHVQQLFGLSADLVGFMDESSLKGGERWSEALMTALATCRVFVPLISPAYLKSDWCAREWHAFHRRPVQTVPPGGTTTPVLPVLWMGRNTVRMPERIQALQLFLPAAREPADLRQEYRREGLYGLSAIGHDSYARLVWRIAQEIWRIDAEHRVEPAIVTDYTRLPSSFQEDDEYTS